jgi:hypothetical protein
MNASTKRRRGTAALLVVAAVAMLAAARALAQGFGPWSAPVNAESVPGTSSELNTSFQDGCPILSPDGLSLYMASNRPGGMGGLDIWVATRASRNSPFGAPANLGAPVNSTADDFCPSPMADGWFFFVSTRAPGCGDADIYVTRQVGRGWWNPLHLGCRVNSPGQEGVFAWPLKSGNMLLYFSSNRAGGFAPDTGTADHDMYVSPLTLFGFAPPQLVPGLNTPQNDARPNLRSDGLEIVFDSDRPGGRGGPDLYSATRGSRPPGERRASLSWDGTTCTSGAPGRGRGSSRHLLRDPHEDAVMSSRATRRIQKEDS